MTQLRRIFTNKQGGSFPLVIATTLILFLLMTVIFQFFRLVIIGQGVRDSLQTAAVSTVTENYANVYHAAREGYAAGYLPAADSFAESIHYGDIYAKLKNVLGLSGANGTYTKTTANGQTEFTLSGLQVDVRNVPLRSGDNPDRRFEIDASILLEVPISFAGETLPPMRVRIHTTAGYTPKF